MTDYNLPNVPHPSEFKKKKFIRRDGHIYRIWDGLDEKRWQKNETIGIFKKTKKYLKENGELDKKNMEVSKEEEDGCETPRKQKFERINIYGEEYNECLTKAIEFENSKVGNYYKSNLCLKPFGNTSKESTLKSHFDNIAPYISNTFEEIQEHIRMNLCVLPKNHAGKCSCVSKLFIPNKLTKKLEKSIEMCVYTTPGDNDFIFKNRDKRLYPIALTKKQELKIRNTWNSVKEKKLKCAIPLKEQSTPFMLATAYFDYITYIVNINGIENIIDKESQHYKISIDLLNKHKVFLNDYYKKYNRYIFSNSMKTICPVRNIEFKVEDLADITRDNRTVIKDDDAQLGHLNSRKEKSYTIYGTNILIMSRRGNLIIGENNFIDDEWINELYSCIKKYKL